MTLTLCFGFGGLAVGTISRTVVHRDLWRPRAGPAVPLSMKLDTDQNGKVQVATPFGVVRRDPMMLPPMVAMAFENSQKTPTSTSELEKRLAEIRPALLAEDTRPKLAAMQELNFFPPALVEAELLDCIRSSVDELVRSQGMFVCALHLLQGSEDGKGLVMEDRNPYFAEMVVRLKTDGSPTVRSASAGAMGLLRGSLVLKALETSFVDEKDWLVKMSAVVSLGSIGDTRACPGLLECLQQFDPLTCENDSLVVQGIIGALGQLKAYEALDTMMDFRRSEDFLIRQQVAEALQAFRDTKVIPVLEELVFDKVDVVSIQAKHSLAAVKNLLAVDESN